MSIRTYERFEAQTLIPFLQSIAFEVAERRNAVRKIEAQLAGLLPESDKALQLQADRANHRKEMRLALRELTHIGCTATREFPLQVSIPGPSGTLDGYSWNTGDKVVELAFTENAA